MSTPDSVNSDYLPADLEVALIDSTSNAPMEKCAVCGKPAFCYNYGVLTCNACKMFFRRVEVDQITYTCKQRNSCYDGHEFIVKGSTPRCRSCRYQRCLQLGMKYIAPEKSRLALINRLDKEFVSIIESLMFFDSRRAHRIYHCYTEEDPTLHEMVTKKSSQLVVKTKNQKVGIHEWSFLAIYTTVELFLSFDFMQKMSVEDKVVLLQNFAMKSMVFNGAMRALANNTERVMSPDGSEVYPDILYELKIFSVEFLNGIRSRLVARLRELKVTKEEHVLLNAVLFCNPAIQPLSSATKKLITCRQKSYSAALFQYCLLTYQQSGPSRFADLLSICTVLNRQAVDVSSLSTLFQIRLPSIQYKKLFVDVCQK
uniref:Nuclear receptor domain-containing protein n=1 Tax=Caenorhabditis tropicalis TaxID=1561998 RepID=A0A1I7TY65_9PELO